MTRKDYELIASVFAKFDHNPDTDTDLYDAGYSQSTRDHARLMSGALKRDNPRFDPARFLKACGIED